MNLSIISSCKSHETFAKTGNKMVQFYYLSLENVEKKSCLTTLMLMLMNFKTIYERQHLRPGREFATCTIKL